MSEKKTENEPTALDEAIERILEEMKNHNPSSDEYPKMVDQLEKLYKIKQSTMPEKIKLETLIPAAAHIGGLLMILSFEKTNVLATKALGFVIKPKI